MAKRNLSEAKRNFVLTILPILLTILVVSTAAAASAQKTNTIVEAAERSLKTNYRAPKPSFEGLQVATPAPRGIQYPDRGVQY